MGPKLAPNSVITRTKNGPVTGPQVGWVWDGSFDRFWTIWDASWKPKSNEKQKYDFNDSSVIHFW